MSGQQDSKFDLHKRNLRTRCIAAREAVPAAVRAAGATAIGEVGIGFAGASPGAIVSAYMAMGAELDPAALVARLAREGWPICLPVVQPLGQPLRFRAWSPGEALVARTWGIREPADGAPEVSPDVLLVPLLAFDRRGNRLGYGGGYYDRTLAALRAQKPVIAIGLAFAVQRFDEVPSGPHDQRLDWVLTPDGPERLG